MVKSKYANYNKYLRQLASFSGTQLLLEHFVVPTSVVFTWNRISLLLKGAPYDSLDWDGVTGCVMRTGNTTVRREDLNHLIISVAGSSQIGRSSNISNISAFSAFSAFSDTTNLSNASNASNASSGGGAGSAGVGSRVNERLFDEATLLWVALAGSECPKEKAPEALARYFLLLDVFRAANRHAALATQSHTLFFNLSSFKTALRLSSPLPTTLATVAGTINTDSSLLQPLAPPRRALASLPLLTPQPPPPRLLLLLLLPAI